MSDDSRHTPRPVTITHTAAEGTLIDGTFPGDGTSEILKACGWRYSRSVGWFIPHSRDRLPKVSVIGATLSRLQEAGFITATDIEQTLRSTEQVETSRRARQETRVHALTEKAQRKAGAAEAAEAKASEAANRMPLAQPILVGHHSEGRLRRHYEHVASTTNASILATDEARRAAARAATASSTTDLRYAPRTVARRIERLEADERKLQRTIDEISSRSAGISDAVLTRLQSEHSEVADQIGYWKRIRAEQLASGEAREYSPASISVGDLVKYRNRWLRVIRVNPKTVSVEAEWSTTVSYSDLEDHRSTAAPAT